MTDLQIVTKDEWLDARRALLAEEKEFSRTRDALSARRREMPAVKLDRDYIFVGKEGETQLSKLFGDHGQLIIYHFMFGPDWEEGCPSCSFWADSFDGAQRHLQGRDTAFACVSNAPLATLLDYQRRLGWSFNWLSDPTMEFGQDFGVTFPDKHDTNGLGYNYSGNLWGEEMPGLSVFLKTAVDGILHTYSTYSRGLDAINATYQLLDLTPKGRDEGALPWPMAWLKRNDSY